MIPGRYEPVLLIKLGKEDKNSIRKRWYRKTVKEFVDFEEFN